MAGDRQEAARRRKLAAKRAESDAPSPAHEKTLVRLGIAAIVLGVLFRIASLLLMDLHQDGAAYLAMGRAWMETHTLLMPTGDVYTRDPTPVFSHHFPPAFPVVLGAAFTLFGYGLLQARLVYLALSLAALAAIYLTTRDLYGKLPALLVTGLLALEPHLVWATGTGFSENLSVLLFVLTMWAIVRSLKDERFILLAGLFAGLAYLSRASMGSFFFVAGFGGLAWRLWFKGWRLFTDPWYLGAIAIFGSIVGGWALRNVTLFGWPHWETSEYVSILTDKALANPGALAKALAAKLPLFLLFLVPYVVPFFAETKAGLARWREEETSALLLSVALAWVLAWLIASTFWVYEQTPLWWLDNHRYVLIGIIPLAWLLLRDARPSSATVMKYGTLFVALLLVCGVVLAYPNKYPENAAGQWMAPYVHAGDEIAVTGNIARYAIHPYLAQPDAVQVYHIPVPANHTPTWLVSINSPAGSTANYTLVATFRQTYLNDPPDVIRVYVEHALVAERGIPTGVKQG